MSATPIFRRNLDKILIAKFKRNLNKILIAKLMLFKKKDELKNIPEKKSGDNITIYEKLDKNLFTPISKGIYAQDLNKGTYILIKENEVEWIEYTFNIKGKKIKIKVPKGEPPPEEKLLEQIYK